MFIKKVVLAPSLFILLILAGCGQPNDLLSEGTSSVGNLPGQEAGQQATGDSGGVNVSNTFSQPKELGKGDLLFVDMNSSQGSLDFSGVDPNAEFLLSIANTSSTQQNFSVQMNSDLSSASLDVTKAVEEPAEEPVVSEAEDPRDITEIFHEVLRIRERDQEGLQMPEILSASKSVSKSVNPSISEGDKRSFKVLASLSSSTSYVEVSATAECIGSNVAFYVDDRVTQDMLSSSDVHSLCLQFDDTAAKEQDLFGQASDINGDGKTVVLFTPQVNHLGSLGGGIVTGFFNSIDLHPANDSNPASNEMEILYIMVPDPNGTYGLAVSKSFALSNLIPAVLPHEFQHAISYNQHVFINKGVAEDPWLNEGMSHLAEDLFGQNQENPSRYSIFLSSPSSYSLVTGNFPGLAARGAAYLFLRYLYEQSPDGKAFLKKLVQTSQIGTKNIETAFAGSASDFDQFGEFFLRWTVALGLTDSGITQDRRYTYQPRTKDPVTGNWSGVCLRCSADDNRGTVLSGVPVSQFSGSLNVSTLPSSVRFYKISGLQSKINISGGNGNNGYGVLIRTK